MNLNSNSGGGVKQSPKAKARPRRPVAQAPDHRRNGPNVPGARAKRSAVQSPALKSHPRER
jgi:hypothetical protein